MFHTKLLPAVGTGDVLVPCSDNPNVNFAKRQLRAWCEHSISGVLNLCSRFENNKQKVVDSKRKEDDLSFSCFLCSEE